MGELRTHFPKVLCSIITWLDILNRLYTEDRLVLFGTKSTSLCSFFTSSESHDHLFFNCPYTSQVWGLVTTKLNANWADRSWANWIDLLSSIRGNTLRSIAIKLALTATVYHIWIERNFWKFQNIACPVPTITHKIYSMIKLRLLSLDKLPQGTQSSWFISQWDLTPS